MTAEFPGRVLVGEAYLPVEELATYFGSGADPEFDLAFDFELLLSAWEHRELALAIERSEALHPAASLPTFAISNHDQPRHATRWGAERTRAAAFLLLTLRGVAVLYAGEEIGMGTPTPPSSPIRRSTAPAVTAPARRAVGRIAAGRVHDRPPVAAGHRFAGPQRRRPVRRSGSLLSLYRRLIAARHDVPALGRGSHRSIFGVAPDVLAWVRELEGERVLALSTRQSNREPARSPASARMGRSWWGPIRRGGVGSASRG